MKVDDAVLAELARATTDGSRLVLAGQLDRAMYARVDAAIKAAGGVWKRHQGAHVFPGDAAEAVARLAAGEVLTNRETGFFPTPPGVAASLVLAAGLRDGDLVLEPSAGNGILVRAAVQLRAVTVDAVENDPGRARQVRETGLARNVWEADFLSLHPSQHACRYDAAVMNPPFGSRRELRHVAHAADFVRPGGTVAAILPASVLSGTDKANTGMRERIERTGTITPLGPEAFREAGTGVSTVIAVFTVSPETDGVLW